MTDRSRDSRTWTVRRPTSRRYLLRGAAYGGAGLAAAFALACGSGNNKTTTTKETTPAGAGGSGQSQSAQAAPPAEGEPKRGGTFKLSQTTSFSDVMDPHTSLNQAAYMWSFIGNTALRLNREGTEIVPELVEKWEAPGDGTEVLLTIRQGVKWHDKPPVSARAFDTEDLAWNLMHISGKLNPSEIGRFQRSTTLTGLNKTEVVDAKTVRVVLDKPSSTFLNGLTDFRNSMAPRDFADKGGKYEDPAALVGTGAFMAESWKDNEKGIWKRNPAYWKQGQPYLDGLTWVWIPDKLSRLSAFAKGDLDVFNPPTTTKSDRDVLKKTAPSAREEKWPYVNWNHLRFNTQRKPFDDKRVRKALQLALTYKTMGDAFFGDGYWDYTGPLASSFPEAIPSADVAKLPGWNPATKDADIATAKQLMTAAGFPDGSLSFKLLQATTDTSSAYYDFSIRAVDQLKQIWPAMKAEIDIPPDGATFSKRQVQGDFDVIAYVIYSQPDAVLELSSQYQTNGSRNYGKFKDQRVDDLLSTAVSQLDRKQRAATLNEVQKYLIEDQMPIITISSPLIVATYQKNVRGATGYGGRAEGGGYDTWRRTEAFWFAT